MACGRVGFGPKVSHLSRKDTRTSHVCTAYTLVATHNTVPLSGQSTVRAGARQIESGLSRRRGCTVCTTKMMLLQTDTTRVTLCLGLRRIARNQIGQQQAVDRQVINRHILKVELRAGLRSMWSEQLTDASYYAVLRGGLER